MRVSADVEAATAAVTAAAAVGCSLWLVGGYRRGQGGRCLLDFAGGGNGELIVTGIIRL